MKARKVIIEVTLPSGHVEALDESQVDDMVRELITARPTLHGVSREVVAAACDATNSIPALVFGDGRPAEVVLARWLIWEHLVAAGLTREQIGKMFNREQSGVTHGVARLKALRTHGAQWQKAAIAKFEALTRGEGKDSGQTFKPAHIERQAA